MAVLSIVFGLAGLAWPAFVVVSVASCPSSALSFPLTEEALFIGLPALIMLVLVVAVRRLRNASLRRAVAAGLGLADVASVVLAFLISLDLAFASC